MSIILDGTSGITSPGGDTASVSYTTPIVKSGSSLTLQTNGSTTAVTIDASQNVGIGTTSPSAKLDVAQSLNGASTIRLTNTNAGASASAGLSVANSGSSGQFTIAGASYGGYGAWTANDTMAYASTNLVLMADSGSGVIKFAAGGNGEKMRITSSGNLQFSTSNAGIVFSNSSAVTNSTLNDYETGSFSPTILFGGANAGQTFNNGPNGRYVKIGKFVYILVGWYFSSKGSSTGTMTIGNLPFTADNFGFYGTYSPACFTSLTSVPNNIVMIGTNGATNYATVYQGDCGTALTNSNINNSTYALIGFAYTANF